MQRATVPDPLHKILIRSIGKPIDGIGCRDYAKTRGRRFAIPALKGYECLAVYTLPFGVAWPNLKTYWIISPSTSMDRDAVIKTGKDVFTKQIIESEPFGMLVGYVKQHAVNQATATEENIREAYKRLIEEFHDVLTDSQG